VGKEKERVGGSERTRKTIQTWNRKGRMSEKNQKT